MHTQMYDDGGWKIRGPAQQSTSLTIWKQLCKKIDAPPTNPSTKWPEGRAGTIPWYAYLSFFFFFFNSYELLIQQLISCLKRKLAVVVGVRDE